MKKQLLSSLLITTLVLGATAGTVFAAENDNNDSTKTVGEAGFKAYEPDDKLPPNKVVKPGDEDQTEIEVPGGSSTAGVLRFEHVPGISFGQDNLIDAGNQKYDVTYNEFTEVDSKKSGFMPAFLQIRDLRPVATGSGFEVSVRMDSVFKDEKGHELENTTMRLNGATITNTGEREASLVTPIAANYLTVGIGVDGDTSILTTATDLAATNEQVNTTISSLVFENDYVEADYQLDSAEYLAKDLTADSRNNGIQLVVPGKDTPNDKTTYKTDLVWTIVDHYVGN